MNLTVCNVHLTPNSEKTLYASNALLKQLDLNEKKSVCLRFGKITIPAVIKPIRKSGKHLYIPTRLCSTLHVPRSGSISLLHESKGVLQIGPLIGIMSDGSPRSSPLFGSSTEFIRKILRAAYNKPGYNKPYVFAFTPGDINWENDTIYGYFLSTSGSWVRRTVPLPDVVYNRLLSRRAETSGLYNVLRERFMNKKIPFFNWSFFNKSEVYALLKDEIGANQHVPESIMNPNTESIRSMLERHQFAYYKPSGGSLGIGIYRLTYLPKKGYLARYTVNGRNVLLHFKTFSRLMRALQAKHGHRLRNYVIQQGVRLIEIDDCPIDFRFHMHKNIKNEWSVVGIGAKKAGKGSVTTHVKNGGQLMTPNQALHHSFGDRAEEVLNKAKGVAISLAEAIERNYPHLLGELGFDIGIDHDEHVWMLEANAKPGRSIFKHPSLRNEGQASVDHILDYCLYLSKFWREDTT